MVIGLHVIPLTPECEVPGIMFARYEGPIGHSAAGAMSEHKFDDDHSTSHGDSRSADMQITRSTNPRSVARALTSATSWLLPGRSAGHCVARPGHWGSRMSGRPHRMSQ